ncbi:MAG: MiaB/RimO family radical SAM methylthiotransferase [Candidatus Nealsonbacteria bacterium]|nr:MiaB/RimO family radical SAM methylthiotransferase [Candidatus Nealsonbacteria bacterium]
MKYHIITYGCQMNKADSGRAAAMLEKKGYKPTKDIKAADLILVNMCSVRQSAVDRVHGLFHKFEELKIKNRKLKTILTGCVLKKDQKKLREIFDDVQPGLYVKSGGKNNSLSNITISNGCNNFCTYCVVPFTRGNLVCHDHRAILKTAKRAVKAGAREIWLLGQNVNDYQSGAVNFAKLVAMINAIPGDFRFFFTSPHPKNFSDELIVALAKCQKFSKRLNLPAQSGDDEILKRMGRNYTVKQYEALVKKIRKNIPDINLSTDVIVGFPGETRRRFNNTAKLFRKIKFNIAYVAKYSPRPGTAAANLKDDVPRLEKKRREQILNGIIKNGQ